MMDPRARAERYAEAARERICADLAGTSMERNDALNRAAFALGRLDEYLDRSTSESALFAAAQANGYVGKDGAAAARATIRSGLSRGALHPRHPPLHDSSGADSIHLDPTELARRRALRQRAAEAERADTMRRQRLALAIWKSGTDPHGTPVERYLNSRALELAAGLAGDVLRFVERCRFGDGGATAPCMVALLRDPLSREPLGVHRTALTPDGRKSGRKMLGPAGAVMLDAFEEITTGLAIGEGVESCLAARQLGIRPAWALCSTSGVSAFPVLPGIEALTLLVENDENGASERACQEAGTRWHAAGRVVDLVRPRIGKDLNDTIRRGVAA